MNDVTLKDGSTFLAKTLGSHGSWAKAKDPITALKKCFDAEGKPKKCPIVVVKGQHDELTVSGWGSITWNQKNDPTPIGAFTVTSRSIKPMAKGDFDEFTDSEVWTNDFQKDVDYHSKKNKG